MLRVTPLPHRAPVTFAVDGPDARVQGARTIGARTPFRLGATPAGIVRVDEGREPSVVWPGPPGTLSFIASVGLDGYGNRHRPGRGGARGDIVFGWLAENGARSTDLGRLDVGARRLGPPAMGVGDDGVLTVFAARARAKRGRCTQPWPSPASCRRRRFASSPATLRRTGSGRPWSPCRPAAFCSRWLEGIDGQPAPAGRPLDRKLRASGPIVEVANDAGLQLARGGLAMRHGRVLSLHTVRGTGGAIELWGAILTCS